jgi:hypothetical protein
VEGRLGDRSIAHLVVHDDARWTLNGEPIEGLESLVDLDLSFTPATNIQQLRRVPIKTGQRVPIPVAWLDIESGMLSTLPQFYERRGETTLSYEAPSVGYQGLLELADNGFIADYPGLWKAEL